LQKSICAAGATDEVCILERAWQNFQQHGRKAMNRKTDTTPRHPDDVRLKTSKAISVIAVDDRPLMMSGIDRALSSEADISLVAKITTVEASHVAIEKFRPDVVLLKLHMEPKGALDAIELLQKIGSRTRPVILAERMTNAEFMRAMQMGVRGVFSMVMPASLLPRCVRVVHAGEEFIDRDVWRRTFDLLVRRPAESAKISKFLTAREHAVAELALSGMRNKEVARKLEITEGTVKVHLHRIYAKLKIDGRAALEDFVKDNTSL
jgi:two-component system nitrate/nitrite response regulator NarL